jgi:hypothetical protein
MLPKPLINSSRWRAILVLPLVAIVAAAGCSYAINNFADESLSREEMMSPSERQIRTEAESHPPIIRQREGTEQEATVESGAVVHWPLWWEDEFEYKGSDDGKFAWTYEDYFALPYSWGRFLLNTGAWPVSAIVTPPGTPMVSDGRLSQGILGRNFDDHPVSQSKPRPTADAAAGADQSPEEVGPPLAQPQRAHIEYEEVGPVGESADFEEDEDLSEPLPPLVKQQK